MKSCCWRSRRPSTFKRERRRTLRLSGEGNWLVEIGLCSGCAHRYACFTPVIILCSQFRKEKKDKQQVVSKDETILALERKLEEKEQEYQRLKQSTRKRAKTSAARTVQTRGSNSEVWISEQRFTSSMSECSYYWVVTLNFLCLFVGETIARIWAACRASSPEWFGLTTGCFFLSRDSFT